MAGKSKIKMIKFPNGSTRSDDSGKGKPSLMMVHALIRLSKLCEKGCEIHGPFNYERGQYQSRYIDSLMRHILKYMGGAKDEDHLAAIMWNAGALIQQEELINRGLMDPKYNDHRVLLDENGKQTIPMSIFSSDEFQEKSILKKRSKKKSKKK